MRIYPQPKEILYEEGLEDCSVLQKVSYEKKKV